MIVADQPDTVIGYLKLRDAERPERLCSRYIFPDRQPVETTYRQLTRRTGEFAALYAANGVVRGDVVLVILPHHDDLMPSFLGAMWLGAIAAFLPPPTPRLDPAGYYANLRALASGAQPRAIMTSRELAEGLRSVGQGGAAGPLLLLQDDAARDAEAPEAAASGPEDIALIQFSSGSTGLQKGALLSHRALLAEMHGVADFFEFTERDSFISWVPLYHDWGLFCVALHSLQLGTHYTLISPMHWVMKPVVVCEAISAYKPSVYYQPNFAFNYMTQRVRDSDMKGLDLSSIRLCCNGAEPCFFDSHKMFADRFSAWGLKPETLGIVYGMAEVTNSVFAAGHKEPIQVDCIDRKLLQEEGRAQPVSESHPHLLRMLGVGRALTGTRFTIFDDSRREVAERIVGEVVIRSEARYHGYYRNQAATDSAAHDGWYLTGDLGYRVGGILFITGRKSDVIIAGGVNIYPQDVEKIVGEHPDAVAGRVAALGMYDSDLGTERLVVIVESRSTQPEVLKNIAEHARSRVLQELGVTVDRIYHAPHRWVIKTSSGKVARGPNLQRLPELASGRG